MTEPTAEQVNAERERAHEFAISTEAIEAMARGLVESPSWDYDGAREVEKEYYRRFARQCLLRSETVIATAMARVRKEAHAAGRDEGLGDAEKRVMEQLEHWRQNCQDSIDAGRAPPQYNMGARSEAALAVRDIRALRGRT